MWRVRRSCSCTVASKERSPWRAVQELKGFRKVFLQPGERALVSFRLSPRDFAWYDVAHSGWSVEGGTYELRLGASSRDIRLTVEIQVPREGAIAPRAMGPACYAELAKHGELLVSDEDFAALLGHPIPSRTLGDAPLDLNSSVAELLESAAGARAV